ncbi:hypothetical protein OFM21_32405, partial [Escherichia coli]|nr:hypothetical protein [Escherichia coli]
TPKTKPINSDTPAAKTIIHGSTAAGREGISNISNFDIVNANKIPMIPPKKVSAMASERN